jgi:glycosyltransferase involved in cell wall biosynthesis
MDRGEHLRQTLPSLLDQDYPHYAVYVVDNGSADRGGAVLEAFGCSKLKILRRPRPKYFSLAETRNCGVRYSFSDACLFMDADRTFSDSNHLSRIVSQFRHDNRIQYDWLARWRQECGYRVVAPGRSPPPLPSLERRAYSLCLSSCLLLDRSVLQSLGGYDQSLSGWGYEDTDLCLRLELCGLGMIEMEPVVSLSHEDSLRVINYPIKDRSLSWQQNRLRSDRMIARFGCRSTSSRFPGRSRWIEIDGSWWDGAAAAQQDWTMPTWFLPLRWLRKSADRFRGGRDRLVLQARVDE